MNKNKSEFDPLSWQQDVVLAQAKHKAVWKFVALLGWLLSVILAIAIASLAPLKEVKPVFVRVNDTNGVIDVYESLDNRKIDITEAMEKTYLFQYINARERYLYQTYAEDYQQVNIMSIGNAKLEYNEVAVNEDHPDNYFSKYSDEKEVRIRIKSISFLKEGVASVRFVKEVRSNAVTISKTNLIATVTFEYVERSVTEQLRLLNPLDFAVSQYRTDKETL